MDSLATTINTQNLPGISDPGGLHRLSDLIADLATENTTLAETLSDPSITPLMESIFGNSPFLSQCIAKEPAFTATLVDVGADMARDQLFQSLRDTLPALSDTPQFMTALRVAKRQVALLTAMADIGGVWGLEQVTNTLSEFANIAVDHTVAHLLRQSMVKGDLPWPNGEDERATPALGRQSGYFVLAMGKLGASELNYSSDIDLICFFEFERVNYQGRKSIQDCLVKLTRDLVKILQERTGDGYVFRVDLRLRPDAGATPVAISTEAAEIYYQSLGLNWERAAMIKARTMAGDLNAGDAFLRLMQPFIWRKNLDFAALDDIRAMKERIHDHHGHTDIGVAGHDVKLGPGGIREIEFFVQSQQLISGGRLPVLRDNRTLQMLAILHQEEIIEVSVSEDLQAAYHFLRRLEHRLQMVRDEQTHTMPSDLVGLDAIATFMAYDSETAFSAAMMNHLGIVRTLFSGLFANSDDHQVEHAETRFLLAQEDLLPKGIEALKQLGFEDPKQAGTIVRGWATPRYRACRSDRAQTLLAELLPSILQALAATSEPDQALVRFDEFLSSLPSGIQMFSLFQSNPKLLELLAQIIGSAPALAAMIGRSSALFDVVLDAGFFAEMPDQQSLRASLKQALASARDFQDILDGTRRWTNERRFQIGVKTLQGSVDAEASFIIHTDLAEVSIGALYPAVCDAFVLVHGTIQDSHMATIAMGSFGGIETSFTSDLDMIFVYNVPDLDQQSDGKKPLLASQYYTRLSQRFINSITAQTSEGRLYEVDMRLRPSGNAGPIALSLEAFDSYQQTQAWTWEHMALTRARVVGGPKSLRQVLEQIIHSALCRPRDHEKLLVDVAKMRRRLAEEFTANSPWQVKHIRGGLVDIEFLAQYLQLRHAHDYPDILQPHTISALKALQDAKVLNSDDAQVLINANTKFGAVRAFMRQCMGTDSDPTEIASIDMQAALAQAADAADVQTLQTEIVSLQKDVLAIYARLIEEPANAIERATASDN